MTGEISRGDMRNPLTSKVEDGTDGIALGSWATLVTQGSSQEVSVCHGHDL